MQGEIIWEQISHLQSCGVLLSDLLKGRVINTLLVIPNPKSETLQALKLFKRAYDATSKIPCGNLSHAQNY